uniref:Uncharacterized protein n=1 Tax=Panagrolaimus sp. ES5 TaxID=591445 RepID=A0AC34GWZ6_9BILA
MMPFLCLLFYLENIKDKETIHFRVNNLYVKKMRGIRLHSGCLHNYHHQRKSCGTIYSVPCSPPRSPPPSPVSRAQLNKELSSMTSINDPTCTDCSESPKKCPYFFHRLDHELQRLTT